MKRLDYNGEILTGNELRCSMLEVAQTDTAICLCVRADVRQTSSDNKPFIRFTLKDVTGTAIYGYLFNVDSDDLGYIANTYKNVPLEVSYTVGCFKGTYNLQIERAKDINIISEEHFNRQAFMGAMPVNREMLDSLCKDFNVKCNENVYTQSLLQVYDGKIGGFAYCLCRVCNMLKTYEDEIPNAISVALVTGFSYFKYLSLIEKASLIDNTAKYSILSKLINLQDSVESNSVKVLYTFAQDALGQLMGLSTAKFLVSKVVADTFQSVFKTATMIQQYQRMIPGTEAWVGGEVLLKE